MQCQIRHALDNCPHRFIFSKQLYRADPSSVDQALVPCQHPPIVPIDFIHLAVQAREALRKDGRAVDIHSLGGGVAGSEVFYEVEKVPEI